MPCARLGWERRSPGLQESRSLGRCPPEPLMLAERRESKPLLCSAGDLAPGARRDIAAGSIQPRTGGSFCSTSAAPDEALRGRRRSRSCPRTRPTIWSRTASACLPASKCTSASPAGWCRELFGHQDGSLPRSASALPRRRSGGRARRRSVAVVLRVGDVVTRDLDGAQCLPADGARSARSRSAPRAPPPAPAGRGGRLQRSTPTPSTPCPRVRLAGASSPAGAACSSRTR